MANRTVKDAKTVHGTNPQYLVEKIIRTRIYESRYWKEECFALNAELLVDRGIDLRYIGGIYGGNIKPTPFLCLVLKMLQIQPDKDIVIEFIRQEDFKYVRALGAFYLRLTGTSLECYKYLEPLYNDFRKLRRMDKMGQFDIIHMDEFIDILLREERVFDVILPRVSKRQVHEEATEIEPRISILDDDLDAEAESEEEEQPPSPSQVENLHLRDERSSRKSPSRRHRSRSPSRKERRSSRSPHGRSRRSRSKDRRERSRSRDRRDRKRSSSRSPKRSKSKKSKKEKSSKKPEEKTEEEKKADEIAQANVLRAKLGLKPLRP